MTHAEAIEAIKQGGHSVRLLLRRLTSQTTDFGGSVAISVELNKQIFDINH